MSLCPKTIICFSNHAESSRVPKQNKTRVAELANWKEKSQLESKDDEGTYIMNRDIRTLYSQPDPMPEQRWNPLSLTDSVYTNSDYDIHQSISALFTQLWDTDRSTGWIQGWIWACIGGECQWYQDSDISFFSCPDLYVGGSTNLELINQVQHPDQNAEIRTFSEGQVMWHRRLISVYEGYQLEYNLKLYIILRQARATYQYMLLDSSGCIHPDSVLPEQLELIRTTWTTARVPNTWYCLDDVHKVLN